VLDCLQTMHKTLKQGWGPAAQGASAVRVNI